VLEAIRTQHAGRFDAFGLACSQDVKRSLLSQPLPEAERAVWQAQAQASLAEQAQIEAADTLDFEAFRQRYVDPAGLTVRLLERLRLPGSRGRRCLPHGQLCLRVAGARFVRISLLE